MTGIYPGSFQPLLCFALLSVETGIQGVHGMIGSYKLWHTTFKPKVVFSNTSHANKTQNVLYSFTNRFKAGEKWFDNLRMPPSSDLGWGEMVDQMLGGKGFVSLWTVEDNKSLSLMTPLVFKQNVQNPLFVDGISLHLKANREHRHLSWTIWTVPILDLRKRWVAWTPGCKRRL